MRRPALFVALTIVCFVWTFSLSSPDLIRSCRSPTLPLLSFSPMTSILSGDKPTFFAASSATSKQVV